MKKWAAWVCVTGLALSMLSGCGKEETVDAPVYPEYPTYTAKDYVTLGDYKNLTVQVTSISESPTEEEITARLQEAMSQEAVDEDATVQMGDTVTIDLEGTVDGETFEGGTSENYSVTIGSGKLIDGVERYDGRADENTGRNVPGYVQAGRSGRKDRAIYYYRKDNFPVSGSDG